MKVFSIIQPSSFLPRRPQEDYLFISKKYPIFTVADGVTLQLKKGIEYPKVSGAAEVAEILCKTVISEAEKRYDNFKESDLGEVFENSNKPLAGYNALHGRAKETINYFDVDFFSATTALMLVKNSKAYWCSLCDSGVIVLNKNGRRILSSPISPPDKGEFLPVGWKKMAEEKRAKVMHSYRNKIGPNGELLGYGVADGEKGAVRYLNSGKIDLNEEDLILVYTDGFEEYLKLGEFNKIFTEWPRDLKRRLDLLMTKMEKKSKKKYGLERSLIAIKI